MEKIFCILPRKDYIKETNHYNMITLLLGMKKAKGGENPLALN
jgi:hypothetical protein